MKQIYILLLMALPMFVFAQDFQKSSEDNEQENKKFKLYPNPAYGDEIYLTTETNNSKEVKVFDVFGEVVLTQLLTSNRLNIANLKPGIYVLQVTEEEVSSTRKLVIK